MFYIYISLKDTDLSSLYAAKGFQYIGEKNKPMKLNVYPTDDHVYKFIILVYF